MDDKTECILDGDNVIKIQGLIHQAFVHDQESWTMEPMNIHNGFI